MNEMLQTVSPIDNSIYLEKPYASDKDIQHTIELAKKVQAAWKSTSIAERAEICLAFVEAILSKQSELAEEITWQMGRPIQYAAGEISGFADRARYMIRIAENKLKNIQVEKISGFKRFIQREPVGVVLIMSPWNYPYLTAVNTVIPAIMAGNVVILKPSAQAPLVAERMQQAFEATQLPEGVFQ
ncbi:MAG TPA: aldehyde dehydrogenase family protein, partial [Gammaproteobacteria bacterium]|nr:aldehyde dehydrogenase family protein [Gammaproteobacteria bacterium]